MESTSSVNQPTALRTAETKDVPRIAAVIIAAMDFSPHWTWRYPYRKQFPDVHRQMTEERIADYVKKSKDGICVALVSEVEIEVEVEIEPKEPTTEDLLLGNAKTKKKKEKQRRKEIVGVAIAQLPGTFVEPMTRVIKRTVPEGDGDGASKAAAADLTPPNAPPAPFRADGHLERAKAFGAEFGPAKKRYFDVPYGNNQLYIDFMAVDPNYHRRGIATQLIEWMLELSRREEDAKAVTLFSSPMGRGLYKKVGFEEVGCVAVKLEGDSGEGAEGISAPVMVWKKESNA